MKAEYTPLSSGAEPFIRVNPILVLFTQGGISSTFGEGCHQGMLIDETILELQADPNRVNQIPMINVFELDARLYSINNRRLFVLKVLASMGKLDFVPDRVQIWSRYGSDMAPIWFQYVPDNVPISSRYGPDMVPIWTRHGPDMFPICS